MNSAGEITPKNLEENIQKLREEFNKKSFHNENHPKTSHEYKRANVNKKISRTNKALSANKIKWSNLNKLSDKELFDFYRKHPGYLYYKEIMTNMKLKQFNNPLKKRAFTGKEFANKKIRIEYSNNINYKKMGNTNYNHGNKFSNYNNYSYNLNRNEKFPKISKTNYYSNQNKQKWKSNFVKNYNYNFNYNNFNYSHNHNYNYNINNININIKDKKNPYSLSWVNKILNQNDYKLEIKPKNFIKKEKEKNKFNILNTKATNNFNIYTKLYEDKEIYDDKLKLKIHKSTPTFIPKINRNKTQKSLKTLSDIIFTKNETSKKAK